MFAVLTMGIIFPAIILFQAYAGLHEMQRYMYGGVDDNALVHMFKKFREHANGSDDFRIFGLMFVENSNQKTMINKQAMKVSVMQIGFAIMSLGLMFIILGINDGGAKGSAEISSLKVDIRKASTGVFVFIVGAAMATAGGILKNDYTASRLPNFNGDKEQNAELIDVFKACKKQGGDSAAECFYQYFMNVHKGELND